MLAEEALTESAASLDNTDQDWGVVVDLSPCLHLWPKASLSTPPEDDAAMESIPGIEADNSLRLTLPLGAGGVDELLLGVLGSIYSEVSCFKYQSTAAWGRKQ